MDTSHRILFALSLSLLSTPLVAGCGAGEPAIDDPAAEGALHQAPTGACTDGKAVASSSFVASADGKECEKPKTHCITNDATSCPQQSLRAPGFCADGRIVAGATKYVASADGKECEMPDVHCVTNDASSCPQLSPRAPDFCANGRIVVSKPSFVASADGKECEMPDVHCVTNDASSCPQF